MRNVIGKTISTSGLEWIHWSTTVPQDLTGDRLDHVLKLACPEKSLRQVRRFWAQGQVLVNGRPCSKGHRVNQGDLVTVRIRQQRQSASDVHIEVVAKQGGWAAVNKPCRMHTEGHELSSEPSLEDRLGVLFPESSVQLLNRLDFLTSGLVLLALDPGSADLYAQYQNNGQVEKDYLALVQGALTRMQTIRFGITSAKRKKVAVSQEASEDFLRWTEVFPLKVHNVSDQTLVRVRIRKGIRHQIRAHLASIGHPIVGDPVYGHGQAHMLHLHHQEVTFPGFHAYAAPDRRDWPRVELMQPV